MNELGEKRRAGEAEMGADNTLQLVLDATTNVLTAIYTPPPPPAMPAAQAGGAPGDAAAAPALSLIHI